MPNNNPNTQRGGAAAYGLLIIAFRVAVFFVFAPVAFTYAVRGEWFACGLAAILALGLGAFLTPTE